MRNQNIFRYPILIKGNNVESYYHFDNNNNKLKKIQHLTLSLVVRFFVILYIIIELNNILKINIGEPKFQKIKNIN